MSTDQIVEILKQVATFPAVSLLLIATVVVILAPWGALIWTNRSHERRHQEMRKMYENNASLAEDSNKTSAVLLEVVKANTAAMTRVCDAVEGNFKVIPD